MDPLQCIWGGALQWRRLLERHPQAIAAWGCCFRNVSMYFRTSRMCLLQDCRERARLQSIRAPSRARTSTKIEGLREYNSGAAASFHEGFIEALQAVRVNGQRTRDADGRGTAPRHLLLPSGRTKGKATSHQNNTGPGCRKVPGTTARRWSRGVCGHLAGMYGAKLAS